MMLQQTRESAPDALQHGMGLLGHACEERLGCGAQRSKSREEVVVRHVGAHPPPDVFLQVQVRRIAGQGD